MRAAGRRFWRITLPSLRRTIVLVIMLQTAAQLQLFGQSQLLTAGGPSGASRTAVLFLFETAFGRWELGYASAAAEVLFLIILAVTLTQYWATGRRDAQAERWPRSAASRRLGRARLALSLLAGAAIMSRRSLWTLLLSLKSNAELVGHSEAALHGPYTLENYARDPRQQLDPALAAQQRDRRRSARPRACSSSRALPATVSRVSTSRSGAPCSSSCCSASRCRARR